MHNNFDLTVATLSEPGELPLRLRVASGGRSGLALIFLGAIILITGGAIWTGAMPLSPLLDLETASIVAVAVLIGGVLLIIRGLFSRKGGYEFTVSAEAVKKTAGPGKNWTEPLSSYHGVRWRRQRSVDDWDIHVVELVHPEPSRVVPLFSRTSGWAKKTDTLKWVRDVFNASKSGDADMSALEAEGMRLARHKTGDDVRDVWEGLAALLGMPAIDARTGEEDVRAADDLDKSIGDLAAEGKVALAWDGRPAPDSLAVKRVSDQAGVQVLKIKLLASASPKVVRPACMGIGGLILVLSLYNLHFGWMVSGAIVLGIPFVISKLERGRERMLTISTNELAYKNPMRQGTIKEDFNVPLSEIERVHIESLDYTIQGGMVRRSLAKKLTPKQLVISTDQRERGLGLGLDDAALEWLRDYLILAISKT